MTEHASALGELAVVPSDVDAIARLSGGGRHRVVIFELNALNHAQKRALANAIAIGTLQQLGERLPVVCWANGLQVNRQNDNGWDQGLLFFDSSRVWLQPPGHVERMTSRSYQPSNVPVRLSKARAHFHVAAARSENGKHVTLRIVNAGDIAVAARITLSGFTPAKPTAMLEELAGAADAVNSAEQPTAVVPLMRDRRHNLASGPANCTFPARSFTVVTLE